MASFMPPELRAGRGRNCDRHRSEEHSSLLGIIGFANAMICCDLSMAILNSCCSNALTVL